MSTSAQFYIPTVIKKTKHFFLSDFAKHVSFFLIACIEDQQRTKVNGMEWWKKSRVGKSLKKEQKA